MLKLGIIGTGQISHDFVNASHTSSYYRLQAVYSRTLQQAEAFAEAYAHPIQLFTDLEEMLAADLDVIYIASPNSLHFEQGKKVLAAGKHAIIEKPMVSSPAQLASLRTLAQAHQVFLFEAARNYHEKAFTVIRDFLKTQDILGGTLSYAKYSSKMPQLLAGQTPNVFSDEFSGGALMDLGIYAIYAAVALIGHPQTAHYRAQQLPNSVDLNGHGLLCYDSYLLAIHTGKNLTSCLPTEIYTRTGTLTLDSCQHIQSATFRANTGEVLELDLTPSSHPMLEEAIAIAQAILDKQEEKIQKWLDDAASVHHLLYSMRQDASIHFKADHHDH